MLGEAAGRGWGRKGGGGEEAVFVVIGDPVNGQSIWQ